MSTRQIDIPGFGQIFIENIVFDVNGTLATDGVLVAGIKNRMQELGNLITIHLLTANTYGKQSKIDIDLGTSAVIIKGDREAEQKEAFVESLGAGSVVAIGNGANDALMLKKAALGIVVIGKEGAATAAIVNSQIVVNNIVDALDLLLQPSRIKATLRR